MFWRPPAGSQCAATDSTASTSGLNSSSHQSPCVHQRVRHHGKPHRDRDVTARNKPHEFSTWRTSLPPTPQHLLSVVPGHRTIATQLLHPDKVIERMRAVVHENARVNFGAFYSSELGGIVTDPAFMMLHVDDHMFHRGHGVFDTALITDGYMYQLPQHVERFRQSAAGAGLEPPMSDAALFRILLDTAAASKILNGMVRFWLSAGRGGFALSDSECDMPALYAIATSGQAGQPEIDRLVGWHACTSLVPQKPTPFSRIKSNNYLPNVLAKTQAESLGLHLGFFVDEDGYLLEGPNVNLAIVTQEDVLVVPPLDNILDGITIRRIIELIPDELIHSPDDLFISRIDRRPISIEDALAAKEMFVTGSGIQVVPIVSLDGEIIGDGTAGMTALGLFQMLLNDMKPTEGTTEHIAIPYGYMTGLRDQLT